METRDNNKAIDYARKFTNAELLGSIKQAESNKWFGTLYFHPVVGSKREGVCEFLFQEGICLRVIEPIKGLDCTFNKTVKFW